MTKAPRPRRPREVDQAVRQLRSASRAELAKKEVVQFRMDTEDLQMLYQVCAKHKKPVGTLVREWVLQMTRREISVSHEISLSAGKVNEKISDIESLWRKKPGTSPRVDSKLQSLYERYKLCKQEESEILNELFGILLSRSPET